MGAFGSCLGVGRPVKPGAHPRLLNSNLVNIDASPFGPSSKHNHPNSTQARQLIRPPPTSRQAYLNGVLPKGLPPMPKLMRQSSSLSTQQQSPFIQQQQQQSPQQNNSNQIPKLVDLDDNQISPSGPNQLTSNNKFNNDRKPLLSSSNNISSNNSVLSANGEKLPADTLYLQSIKMNPQGVRNLIALYDYEPRTNDDLGFLKGEHLETCLSLMNEQWWLAKSKSSNKIGWVPSNYVAQLKTLNAEPWYHGKIGRTRAEELLRRPENKNGAFIIRDSDNISNIYSLSLKHELDIKHYKIKQFETGGFYINKKQVFSTIHTLVEHYSRAPDGLCINLREPCVFQSEKPTAAGLSYDACDSWEIDRKCLTIGQELGHGQFGQVFEGLYHNHGNQTRVAIKTLRKGTMDPKDFLAEAQIMKKMKHKHLVKLYAVCSREEPVFIITELMSKGALINYLQTVAGKNLRLIEYINIANQIAQGMSYLEREKYVHRDLAARNILVGDNNLCKIADFGLARFIKETEYEARAGARFPIKWTAPEAANFSKFTIKSDVWSFGIVLYEIITKGGTPYPDMTNAEVLSRIDIGYRMPKPPNCEKEYYDIMKECWHKDPNKRPTFETLEWKLRDYSISAENQYRELIEK